MQMFTELIRAFKLITIIFIFVIASIGCNSYPESKTINQIFRKYPEIISINNNLVNIEIEKNEIMLDQLLKDLEIFVTAHSGEEEVTKAIAFLYAIYGSCPNKYSERAISYFQYTLSLPYIYKEAQRVALDYISKTYIKRKEYQKGIDYIDSLLKKETKHSHLENLIIFKGILFRQQHLYDEAITLYLDFLDKNKEAEGVLAELVMAYVGANKFDKALQYLNKYKNLYSNKRIHEYKALKKLYDSHVNNKIK